MLISLPFLTAVATDDTSAGNTLGEATGQGAFPLSHQFGWHGGIHVQAPGGTSPEKVRAIADGTVIFARVSDEIPAHDADPAVIAAHPLLYYKGWTSNGVVILEHTTEIGEGVSVTFYSIYQHLHTLEPVTESVTTKDAKGKKHTQTQQRPLTKGDKVYRKDPIGTAGAIYGQPHRIHLEIVADEANVRAIMGRSAGPMMQARTSSVWGDTHIRIPAGTPTYATDPRQATLRYPVRLFTTAERGSYESLDGVAAQFNTTPERLRQLNTTEIANVRQRYSHLRDADWFTAINGSHQNFHNLPPPDEAERTITVPALWGDGPRPPHVPAELWATWQVKPQGRTASELIVSISENGGTLTLTTRDTSGKSLGTATESSYELYGRATKQFPGCPSAGYELMRFGRVLGPDALATSDQYRGRVPHLREINLNGSKVFIDLNVAGIQATSDADFPEWQGWTFIDDDTDGNSRCDSQKLIALILAQLPPPESAAARQEAQAAPVAEPPTPAQQQRDRLLRAYIGCNEPAVRERLKRCVVKMPTEWVRDDFDTRWGWVKNAPGDAPANVLLSTCLAPEAYEKFKRHHAALAFWEDAQAAGLALDKVCYHFHPKLFVEIFKRCGWLSEGELTQLLPMSILRKASHDWSSEPVTVTKQARDVIGNTRVELNKALRKFGIAPSSLRMAAFFGNATEETQWFSKLYEGNNAAWYSPWDGRGFLQLTGPDNYIKYWRFRGRAISDALKKELSTAATKAHAEGKKDALQDAKHPDLTKQMQQWRTDVDGVNVAFDPADSAGAYWAWTNAARFADQTVVPKREVQSVSNVIHVYYSCEGFGQVAATVNFGSPVKDASKIAKVNGIVARYQAYTNALVVLDDYRVFPYAQGHEDEMPEGYERRKL